MNTPSIKFHLSRAVLSLALFFLSSSTLLAQNNETTEATSTADQSFSLVYIAQDASMPIQEMEKKLQTAWNRAVQNGPTIFYLSRGREEPVIVKVNINGEDNRADYENVLIPAINQAMTYTVDGPFDKQNILSLLEKHQFLSAEGTALYRETNFDFHVGQDFWMSGNNEAVIASLFFELNIKKYIADEFHFNVFCPRTVTYHEDAGPFGYLNPDDCRRNINLDRSY